jgi:hypothetical protein
MTRSGVLAAVLLTAGYTDCLGVGRENDITVGSDGLALISYHDGVNSTVRVAHCEDAPCARATIHLLDAEGLGATSIATAPDGNGFVAYAARGLRAARCLDASCSAATITLLDDLPFAGHTSVTFGRDGRALISYRDEANGDLKVAHCEDLSCTDASLTSLVEDACCIGRNSAIVMGSDGLGLIAYYHDRRGELTVAHCEDEACRTATHSAVDREEVVFGRFGLAIGSDGMPLLAYVSYAGMKVAHCQDAACRVVDSVATVRVAGGGFQGNDASIAIGQDGLPLIAFPGPAGLLAAHCSDVRCRTATVSRITGESTSFVSAAIGGDGLGIVSFWRVDDPKLRVAHCLDPACTRSAVAIVDAGG